MGLVARRLLDYARLMRADSPAGSLLLLWPTLWGLWAAAGGFPGWSWLLIFVGGVVGMRAFGCVINDMADRRLDAVVARTKERPLAAGRIGRGEAAVVAVLLLLPMAALWWHLPPVAQAWALLALVIAGLYPAAKRFVVLPQAVLGVAFGFGIPVADAAIHNAAPSLQAWLFFIGNFIWVVAYDTIYAMADREDDRAHGGIYSSALLFGGRDVIIVSLLYAGAVLWLSAVGIILGYGAAYQVALIAAMLCAVRFWQFYRTRRPQACMSAFRANHWFGLFVFVGIAASV